MPNSRISMLVFLALLMLTVIPTSGWGQKAGQQSSKARISVVGGESLDFGKVKSGLHRRKLIVWNSGTDTLRLSEDFNTDCGCVSAEAEESILPPNDSTTILVSLLVSGPTRTTSKLLTIGSNDPVRPDLNIPIRMNVVLDLEVTPPTFLVDPKGEQSGAVVVLRNSGDSAITIGVPRLADTIGMKVMIDVPEPFTLRPGEERKVSARIHLAQQEVNPGYAGFPTSSREMPELRVYFVGLQPETQERHHH